MCKYISIQHLQCSHDAFSLTSRCPPARTLHSRCAPQRTNHTTTNTSPPILNPTNGISRPQERVGKCVVCVRSGLEDWERIGIANAKAKANANAQRVLNLDVDVDVKTTVLLTRSQRSTETFLVDGEKGEGKGRKKGEILRLMGIKRKLVPPPRTAAAVLPLPIHSIPSQSFVVPSSPPSSTGRDSTSTSISTSMVPYPSIPILIPIPSSPSSPLRGRPTSEEKELLMLDSAVSVSISRVIPSTPSESRKEWKTKRDSTSTSTSTSSSSTSTSSTKSTTTKSTKSQLVHSKQSRRRDSTASISTSNSTTANYSSSSLFGLIKETEHNLASLHKGICKLYILPPPRPLLAPRLVSTCGEEVNNSSCFESDSDSDSDSDLGSECESERGDGRLKGLRRRSTISTISTMSTAFEGVVGKMKGKGKRGVLLKGLERISSLRRGDGDASVGKDVRNEEGSVVMLGEKEESWDRDADKGLEGKGMRNRKRRTWHAGDRASLRKSWREGVKMKMMGVLFEEVEHEGEE